MRVYDTKMANYHGLRELPWIDYLVAMHKLGELLRAQYEDRLTDGERDLMTDTLRIITATVQAGDPTREADTGRSLAARWSALVGDEDGDALPGHWNTWCVFEDLAAEVAGTAKPYAAAERLSLAVIERWREPYPGKARRIDRDEEVADSTPLARALASVERIIAEAAAY